MATKTFEELKQLAIQIRDEKTNKQNTATRVGTAMLEHINKLEQDYYDKTTINNRTSEYNVSINHPTSGISSSNKYDLSSAIAQVPAELRTDGLTVSFLNESGNTEKWEFGGGSWAVGSFSQVGAGKFTELASKQGYTTCWTNSSTAAKTVSKKDFILDTNCRILVKMASANTAELVTLNVNNTGDIPLFLDGERVGSANSWNANDVLDISYDGTNYNAVFYDSLKNILIWKTDVATTRKQVPLNKRKAGMQISYKPKDGDWVNEQYIGTSFTDTEWGKSSNWEPSVTQSQVSYVSSSLSKITGITTSIIEAEGEQTYTSSNGFPLKIGNTININIKFKVSLNSTIYVYIVDKDGSHIANLGGIGSGTSERQLTYKPSKDVSEAFIRILDTNKNVNTYTINVSYSTDWTELKNTVNGISEELTIEPSDYTTIEKDGTFSNRVTWTKVGYYTVEQGGLYKYSIPGSESMKNTTVMVLYKDDSIVSVLQLADGSIEYEGYLSVDIDANKLYVGYAFQAALPKPIFKKIQEKSINEKLYFLEQELNEKISPDSDLLKTDWEGKTIAFYGDSVTEFYDKNEDANGTYPFTGTGWCSQVAQYFRCAKTHVRGCGGQKFTWDSYGGWTCYINNETGTKTGDTYANYPLKADECPEGHTATRGCACSWLRIINQFPERIKDTIDAVLIMYHNDVGLDDSIKDAEIEFLTEDKTDAEWAASEYYSKYNGDFNIETLQGAIASTIMKFQVWIPNARLILCTPMSTAVDSKTIGEDNTATTTDLSYTMKMYKVAQAVKNAANVLSVPVIDVFHNDGINPLNRTPYVQDMIHPLWSTGNQRLAITVIGGMKTILPNPEKVVVE